jgi:uncharacterized DUF497 family protein
MSREPDDGDRSDISSLEFEWYPPKAVSNLKKHRVSFEEASTIFGDKKVVDLQTTITAKMKCVTSA